MPHVVSFLGCGAVINLATYKDHAVECKARIAKVNFDSSWTISVSGQFFTVNLLGEFYTFAESTEQ